MGRGTQRTSELRLLLRAQSYDHMNPGEFPQGGLENSKDGNFPASLINKFQCLIIHISIEILSLNPVGTLPV